MIPTISPFENVLDGLMRLPLVSTNHVPPHAVVIPRNSVRIVINEAIFFIVSPLCIFILICPPELLFREKHANYEIEANMLINKGFFEYGFSFTKICGRYSTQEQRQGEETDEGMLAFSLKSLHLCITGG